MYKINHCGSFEVTDRGTAFIVKDQGVTVDDIRGEMGKEIEISGKIYIVKGVESYAIGEPMRGKQTKMGILVSNYV